MWETLPVDDIAGATEVLVKAGVLAAERHDGVAVPAADKEQALEILAEGVKKTSSVDVINWSDNRGVPGDFVKIVKDFFGDEPVTLHSVHSKPSHPARDIITIKLWSAPSGDPSIRTPESMWDQHNICHDGSFPFIEGSPIISPEGDVVASVVGMTLYIHHDANHMGNQDDLIVFANIVREFKDILENGARVIDEDHFLKRFSKKYVVTARTLAENRLRQARDHVPKTKVELMKAVQALNVAEATFKAHGELVEKRIKNMEKSLHNIKKMDIERVTYLGNQLVVRTNPIELEFLDKIYDIGRLDISIDHNGNIWISSPERDIVHPHVRDGVCWGNMTAAIPQLLAESQLDVLVQLTVEYLKTFNAGDMLTDIQQWPHRRKA